MTRQILCRPTPCLPRLLHSARTAPRVVFWRRILRVESYGSLTRCATLYPRVFRQAGSALPCPSSCRLSSGLKHQTAVAGRLGYPGAHALTMCRLAPGGHINSTPDYRTPKRKEEWAVLPWPHAYMSRGCLRRALMGISHRLRAACRCYRA